MTSTDEADPFKEIFDDKNASKKSHPNPGSTEICPPPQEKGPRGCRRGKGWPGSYKEQEGPSKSSLLASIFRKFATILACAGFFPYYLVEEEEGYYQVVIIKKSFRYIWLYVCFILNCIIYSSSSSATFSWTTTGPPFWGRAVSHQRFQRVCHHGVRCSMGARDDLQLLGDADRRLDLDDDGHCGHLPHPLLRPGLQPLSQLLAQDLTMLDIDPTDYIKRFMLKEGITFIIMFLLFFIFFLVAASFRICCGLIGCFVFGFVTRNAPEWSGFVLIQLLGFLIVMYGYSGTRAALLQFVFYCRILTNTAKIWNYRFESVLVGALFQERLTPKMFAQYRIILKDHFLVVQLYKLTEGCFGGVLQIYYILQTVCLVLMSLYLYFTLAARKIQVSTYTNFSYQKYDWYFITFINETTEVRDEGEYSVQSTQRALHTIFYIFLFFQGLMSSYHVTAWAQIALDEGMDGFNVLRKHGLVMCTNRSERNLIHSLTISFARNNPLAISADGYFTVDKQLFLMVNILN
ncbi:hypothetical protein Ocin01_14139 [Orchesella cincta]|uniref:Uncharacterized protein n=1 Tax=Orchesella cincta TaxID=48709 RepID=A0A1D2MHW2_ORCCI|nr:hypothetical protein Ocin01_14139 [Orchesella cincta]